MHAKVVPEARVGSQILSTASLPSLFSTKIVFVGYRILWTFQILHILLLSHYTCTRIFQL